MRTLLAITLALAPALLACSKDKAADCQKLVQSAGPRHAAFASAFGQSDTPAETLEAEAQSFEKGAAELQALDVKDEGVKTIANEFASVLTKAAKVRRDQAAASGALDPQAAATTQAAVVSLAAEEMRVKAKIDATCR